MLTEVEKDFARSYAIHSQMGIKIIKCCFDQQRGGNKIVRKPTSFAYSLSDCMKPSEYEEQGDYSEVVPALLLGKINKKRQWLVCIDLDNKHGEEGSKNFYKLFPEMKHIKTWRERTASGGEHLYFIADTRLKTLLKSFKKEVGLKKTGIDLLGEQDGHPKLVFCPPALGVDLEHRHTWVEGCSPLETECAPLPANIKDAWFKLQDGAYKPKHLDDKDLKKDKKALQGIHHYIWQKVISSIENAVMMWEKTEIEQYKEQLDNFLRAVVHEDNAENTSTSWDSGCCYRAWCNLGYMLHRQDLDYDERCKMYDDISQLMPDYDPYSIEVQFAGFRDGNKDPQGIIFAALKLESFRVWIHDLSNNTLLKVPVMVAETAKYNALKEATNSVEAQDIDAVDDFLDGPGPDHEEEDHDDEQYENTEKWIKDKNVWLNNTIKENKGSNVLFRLANLVNKLFGDEEHPIAAVLTAHSIVASVVQYEYAFKILKNKGYSPLNTFTGIFAGSGLGKQILFDLHRKILTKLDVTMIAEPKSPLGVFRQISGKKDPREFVLLIDEAKEAATFLKKKGDKSMDGGMKTAHTKLYDGQLPGWSSKTEQETDILNVFETMFIASAYEEHADDFIANIDFETGIGNRFNLYIAPPSPNAKEKPLEDEYFIEGDSEEDSFEGLLEKFYKNDLPQLMRLRTQFGKYPNHVGGRREYYRKQFPNAIGEEGEPLFEPLEVEDDKTSNGKKKTAAEKQAEENLLKRLINQTEVYNPARLTLDKEDAKEAMEALQKAYREEGLDDHAKRKRLIAVRLAACLELCEDTHKVTPTKVKSKNVILACDIIDFVQNCWSIRTQKYTNQLDPITFNEKSDQATLEKVTKIIERRFRATKKDELAWKDLKTFLIRIKKVRKKDKFMDFVQEELQNLYIVIYDEKGVGQKILRKK